jgi:tripeptidyl-peptidase-1
LREVAQYDALEAFTSTYAPYAMNQNFSLVSINDGNIAQGNMDTAGEGNLDMQYVTALGVGQNMIFYGVGGNGPVIHDGDEPIENTNEPYLETLNYLLAQDKLPQTLTTSYAENEVSKS